MADIPESCEPSIELMTLPKCDPLVSEMVLTSNQETFLGYRNQRWWKSSNSVDRKSRYSFSVPASDDSNVSIKKTLSKTCLELSSSISSCCGSCEPSYEVVNMKEGESLVSKIPTTAVPAVPGSFHGHWKDREYGNKHSIDKKSCGSSSHSSSNGFETQDSAYLEPSASGSSNSVRVENCEISIEVVTLDDEYDSSYESLKTMDQGTFINHKETRTCEMSNFIEEKSRDPSSYPASDGFETDAQENPRSACFESLACSVTKSLHYQSCENSVDLVSSDDECDSSAPQILITEVQGSFPGYRKDGDGENSKSFGENSRDPSSHSGYDGSETNAPENLSSACFQSMACSAPKNLHAQNCIQVVSLDGECDSFSPEMLITSIQGNFQGHKKEEECENSNSIDGKGRDSSSCPARDGSETDAEKNLRLTSFESLACSLPKKFHGPSCEPSIKVISLDDECDSSAPKVLIIGVQENLHSNEKDAKCDNSIDGKSGDLFSRPRSDRSETDAPEIPNSACFGTLACSLPKNVHSNIDEPSVEVITLEGECDSSASEMLLTEVHGKCENSYSIDEKSQDIFSHHKSDGSETDAQENLSSACLQKNVHRQNCEPSYEVVSLEDECNSSAPEMLSAVISAVQGNFHGHEKDQECEKSNSIDEKSQNLFSQPTIDGFEINSDKFPNLDLFEPLACSISDRFCDNSCEPTVEVLSLDESGSCTPGLLMTSMEVNLNVLWKKRGNVSSVDKKSQDHLTNSSSDDSKITIKEFHSLARDYETCDSSEITIPVIDSAYSVEKSPSPNWFDPREDNSSMPSRAQPANDKTIDAENPRHSTPVNEDEKKTSSGPISGGSIPPCLGRRGDEGIPDEDDCLFLTRVVATTTDHTPLVPRKGRLLLEKAKNRNHFSKISAESIAGTFGREPVAELVVSPPKTASPVGRLPPQSGSAAKSSASTRAACSREEAVGRTEPFVSSPPALFPRRTTSVSPFFEEVQPLERQKAPAESFVPGSTRRDSDSCEETRCLRVSARSSSTKTSPSSTVKPWSSGLSLPITSKETEGSELSDSTAACSTKRKSKSSRRKASKVNSVIRCLKPQCKDCVPCFFTAPPPLPSEEGSSLHRNETSYEKHPENVRTWSIENGCCFLNSEESNLEMRTLERFPIHSAITMRQGKKRKDCPSPATSGCLLPEKEQDCVKTHSEESSSTKKRVSFAVNFQDVSFTPDPKLKRSEEINILNGHTSKDDVKEGEGFYLISADTQILKRKRGRPRKDPTTKKGEGSVLDAQIVKRKRGRPRKDPTRKEGEGSGLDPQIKRKRGRPRLDTILKEQLDEVPSWAKGTSDSWNDRF